MRVRRSGIAAAALVSVFLVPEARTDDGDGYGAVGMTKQLFEPHSGLVCPDILGLGAPWAQWWFANRTALFPVDYRASPHARVRIDTAARARARDALLRALTSKDELIASEAALALGRLGDPRDVTTLTRIVADPDIVSSRREHRYAALGLGMLPLGDADQARDARRALVGALVAARGQKDYHSHFWQFCCYALAMRGDCAALPDLIDLRRKGLAAVDARTSIHVDILGGMCFAFGALGADLALPEIEEHLRGRRSPDGGSKDTAWAACHALAQVGGPKAIVLLRRAASQEYVVTRRTALQALGSVADPSDDVTADLLRTALVKDEDPVSRDIAAVSLGRIGHRSSVPTLLDAMQTSKPHCRPYIALGLAFCARRKPDPAISATLLQAIEENTANDYDKSAFALACGLAGVAGARARLADLAAHSPLRFVAGHAAFALGLLDVGPEERKVLHELIATRRDFGIVREAALALGLLRDHTVVEQLRAIVADESKKSDPARATAILSLGRVGDDYNIDFVVSVMENPGTHDIMRACAVQALGWLLDRGATEALARIAQDSPWCSGPKGTYHEAITDVHHLVD